ncbi:MAG: glycosyltransferase family 2 protein [Phyllobacteriaceae bacterium]|nr:glycosyltransferase family 2 protein [Phyllobacteriaceae bacterium]
MHEKLDASFIIPTRNRAAILARTLPIFLSQRIDGGDYEVIVVDDASTDDTPDILRQAACGRLVAERLDRQVAAGAARNIAIRQARSDILILVDDDCFVGEDFLAVHLAAHANAPKIVATGPIIDIANLPAARPTPDGRIVQAHRNPFPSGNVSVHLKLVSDAGLFDEDFNEYGWEDLEFWERLRGLGAIRKFLVAAPVLHYKPTSITDNLPIRLRLERSRGRMGAIFHEKHPRLSVAILTKQLAILRWLDRLLDPLLETEKTVEAIIGGAAAPRSGFFRLLLLNHAEIAAGMEKREALRSRRRAD